jgi:DNA-binding beta-propeller fold protein YncE
MRRVVCGFTLLALCACGGDRQAAEAEDAVRGGKGPAWAAGSGFGPVRDALRYPTRIAATGTGRIAVTDARTGAAFLLDASLAPVAELADQGGALGVAFAPDGALCVGSVARRAVRCHPSHRGPVQEIGAGQLEMPNDLAFDRRGNLYVADSAAHRVRVFDRRGHLVGAIGTGAAPAGLAFPAAIAVAYPPAHPEGELYVADQRHGRVAVFDLAGGFRRALGAPGAAFATDWQGRFARLQALAVDARGRVYALDSVQSRVQVLDGESGAFLGSYGEPGTAPGQLAVPLGLAILTDGRVVATSADTGRLEVLRAPTSGSGGLP